MSASYLRMMNTLDLGLVAAAAIVAGAVNALAGGGTLISFPALVAVGVPPVAANVTNTVALCPGYFGATLAQWNELQTQKQRLWILIPAGIAGGVLGGMLLLHTGDRLFRALVPVLILLASLLLAVQERLRAWVAKRAQDTGSSATAIQGAIPVGVAAVYGGYFGAGLSVIVLAVLGLFLDDSLTRLNALKQAISLSVNVAAAIFFLFSASVVWPAVAVMAAGSILGGMVGGKMAGRIKPAALRWTVVSIGVAVAVIYLVR